MKLKGPETIYGEPPVRKNFRHRKHTEVLYNVYDALEALDGRRDPKGSRIDFCVEKLQYAKELSAGISLFSEIVPGLTLLELIGAVVGDDEEDEYIPDHLKECDLCGKRRRANECVMTTIEKQSFVLCRKHTKEERRAFKAETSHEIKEQGG